MRQKFADQPTALLDYYIRADQQLLARFNQMRSQSAEVYCDDLPTDGGGWARR